MNPGPPHSGAELSGMLSSQYWLKSLIHYRCQVNDLNSIDISTDISRIRTFYCSRDG
jgi:hypothetical protein